MENKENFLELYNKLYKENFNELDLVRKKTEITKKQKRIRTIIVLFMCLILPVCWQLSVAMLVGLITVSIKNSIKQIRFNDKNFNINLEYGKNGSISAIPHKSYRRLFKEKIAKPIIKQIFPDAEYEPFFGLVESYYVKGQWENHERYSSEDRIITEIKINSGLESNLKLIIAEVHAETISENYKGVSYATVFQGLAGNINLPKPTGCYIKVTKDTNNLIVTPKDKIKMDMTEFEKIFDIKTDNKIKAMQILTVDIMLKLVELVKISEVKFEFYINNDIMHMRFHTGEMFEPDILGKTMQYENLKRYFDIIRSVRNITEQICNVINETEF